MNVILSRACYLGDMQLVQYALAHGAEVNEMDGDCGYTYPIADAAEYGHLTIVEELIRRGADVNIDGGIVVRKAVINGNIDVVRLLLQHGVDASETLKLAERFNQPKITELCQTKLCTRSDPKFKIGDEVIVTFTVRSEDDERFTCSMEFVVKQIYETDYSYTYDIEPSDPGFVKEIYSYSKVPEAQLTPVPQE